MPVVNDSLKCDIECALALVALCQQGPHQRQDKDYRDHWAGAALGHHLLRAGPRLRPGGHRVRQRGTLLGDDQPGLPQLRRRAWCE